MDDLHAGPHELLSRARRARRLQGAIGGVNFLYGLSFYFKTIAMLAEQRQKIVTVN
jgi:hypothetical protein